MLVSYRVTNDNVISSAYLWRNADEMLNYHGHIVSQDIAKITKGNFWTSSHSPAVFRNIIKLYLKGYNNEKIDLARFTSLREVEFLDKCKANIKNIKQPTLRLVSFHIPTDICKFAWVCRNCIIKNKIVFTPHGIKHDILFRTSNLLDCPL
jgi:hypothetical protein